MAVPASLWAFQCWFLPCGGFYCSLGSWNHIFGCSDLYCEKIENEFGAVSCLQLGPERRSGTHKQLIRCFSTQTFFPCLWDLLVMVGTLGTFTLSLVVLVLSDFWAPLLIPGIIKCTGANFTAGSNAQLDQMPVFLLCTILVDNAISRQKRSSPFSSCLLWKLCTHHVCFCPAPEDRKKWSQFQAPSYTLFYLSLDVILILFISLACSSSLRSLALCVVTAAPYVPRAVTYHPFLTNAPPSVAAKKNLNP